MRTACAVLSLAGVVHLNLVFKKTLCLFFINVQQNRLNTSIAVSL
jgi:hypothetical protein